MAFSEAGPGRADQGAGGNTTSVLPATVAIFAFALSAAACDVKPTARTRCNGPVSTTFVRKPSAPIEAARRSAFSREPNAPACTLQLPTSPATAEVSGRRGAGAAGVGADGAAVGAVGAPFGAAAAAVAGVGEDGADVGGAVAIVGAVVGGVPGTGFPADPAGAAAGIALVALLGAAAGADAGAVAAGATLVLLGPVAIAAGAAVVAVAGDTVDPVAGDAAGAVEDDAPGVFTGAGALGAKLGIVPTESPLAVGSVVESAAATVSAGPPRRRNR